MEDVQVTFLTSFSHGTIDAHQGNSQPLDLATAQELEAAGLLRIGGAGHAKIINRPAGLSAAGKVPDAGAGLPSSALPVAPVLPKKTAMPSKPGAAKTAKVGSS